MTMKLDKTLTLDFMDNPQVLDVTSATWREFVDALTDEIKTAEAKGARVLVGVGLGVDPHKDNTPILILRVGKTNVTTIIKASDGERLIKYLMSGLYLLASKPNHRKVWLSIIESIKDALDHVDEMMATLKEDKTNVAH